MCLTPLIGKLRLHIQGYVDKEDFFISPLKHEDVILGAPWFDCLATSIKSLERKIFFKFREKNMYINAQESSSTIPLVNDQAFDKSIKSSVSAYMIFVEDSLNGVNETQVGESGMQEDLELYNFLNQFQDVLIYDIPGELPPKQGDDDHMIELIPGSSPPNKPPYRVSQAQQEEIVRQVNELVEKGMVPSLSSAVCSVPLFLCGSRTFLLLIMLHHLYFRKQQRENSCRLQTTMMAMADGSLSQSLNICSSQTPGQIFILSGQSNMAGRGGIQTKHYKDGSVHKEWDRVVPPECDADRGTIWCLNAMLDWVEAREPMHQDIDLGAENFITFFYAQFMISAFCIYQMVYDFSKFISYMSS
ncbi:hypothetical protein L7F22_009921 [Adiantum nelumboides]|nr:hypothetical protein [Adiantum nelumboides]